MRPQPGAPRSLQTPAAPGYSLFPSAGPPRSAEVIARTTTFPDLPGRCQKYGEISGLETAVSGCHKIRERTRWNAHLRSITSSNSVVARQGDHLASGIRKLVEPRAA